MTQRYRVRSANIGCFLALIMALIGRPTLASAQKPSEAGDESSPATAPFDTAQRAHATSGQPHPLRASARRRTGVSPVIAIVAGGVELGASTVWFVGAGTRHERTMAATLGGSGGALLGAGIASYLVADDYRAPVLAAGGDISVRIALPRIERHGRQPGLRGAMAHHVHDRRWFLRTGVASPRGYGTATSHRLRNARCALPPTQRPQTASGHQRRRSRRHRSRARAWIELSASGNLARARHGGRRRGPGLLAGGRRPHLSATWLGLH